MSLAFRAAVVFTVAVILCTATLFLVPHLRSHGDGSGGTDFSDGILEQEDVPDEDHPGKTVAAAGPRTGQTARSSANRSTDREKDMFSVGEMRNEVEEMIRRFRGTPEERQEVIEECENGRELIRLIADLSESSIEEMSPEELEKEREDFEKEYRAQLNYLRTGRLQRMLKTPEEQEIIGGTIETVQDFLERIDAALASAGY